MTILFDKFILLVTLITTLFNDQFLTIDDIHSRR